jgi:hypothetical protein
MIQRGYLADTPTPYHNKKVKKIKKNKKKKNIYIYIYICPSSKALTTIIKHCLDFSFVFSAPLTA